MMIPRRLSESIWKDCQTRGVFQSRREVSATKPVVVLKAGKSDMGTAAALSHTGAIAGSDAIYDGAFSAGGPPTRQECFGIL